MRSGDSCKCDDGWSGINCNMCTSDQACNALMPDKEGGVCYSGGNVVNHNYQMCDVVNKKITSLLGDQKPQVTFTCKKEEGTCQFQCTLVSLVPTPLPTAFFVHELTSRSLG